MKTKCGVIEDLLPLYIDGVCSEGSKNLVEEHLSECHTCKIKYLNQSEDFDVPQIEIEKNLEAVKPFKKIKGNMTKTILVSLVVLLLVFQTGIYFVTNALNNRVEDFENEALKQYILELNEFLGINFPETENRRSLWGWYQRYHEPIPHKYVEHLENNEIPRGFLSYVRELRIYMNNFLLDEQVKEEEYRNLMAAYNQIKSLNDIEKFHKLQSLVLGNPNITDLSPLTKLKNLEDLQLINTDIKDLSPLTGIKNLRNLSIRETGIVDFSHINNFPNLRNLHLVGNEKLTDIRLDGTNLWEIFIDNTKFKSFVGNIELKNLHELEYFRSQGASYDKIVLDSLPRLRTLEIRTLGHVNIDEKVLSEIASNVIEDITIDGINKITNLNFIGHLPTLKKIDLSGIQVEELSITQDMRSSRIETILLNHSQIKKFNGLEHLNRLTSLDLSNNQIEDISFLFDQNDNLIINLRHLDLSNNKIPKWQIEKYEPIIRQQIPAFEMGEQRE